MFWQVVQGVGALVGLATGLFVLWERVTKEVPAAYFVGTPFAPLLRQRFLFLRVVNRSERPIFVATTNGSRPGEYKIAKDDSTRSIVISVVPGESTFVVDGNTTVDFPLLNPPDLEERSLDDRIELNIRWQFVQPGWHAWRHWRLSMTKRAHLLLSDEEATYADDED